VVVVVVVVVVVAAAAVIVTPKARSVTAFCLCEGRFSYSDLPTQLSTHGDLIALPTVAKISSNLWAYRVGCVIDLVSGDLP